MSQRKCNAEERRSTRAQGFALASSLPTFLRTIEQIYVLGAHIVLACRRNLASNPKGPLGPGCSKGLHGLGAALSYVQACNPVGFQLWTNRHRFVLVGVAQGDRFRESHQNHRPLEMWKSQRAEGRQLPYRSSDPRRYIQRTAYGCGGKVRCAEGMGILTNPAAFKGLQDAPQNAGQYVGTFPEEFLKLVPQGKTLLDLVEANCFEPPPAEMCAIQLENCSIIDSHRGGKADLKAPVSVVDGFLSRRYIPWPY